LGGATLGSLHKALEIAYPEYPWIAEYFSIRFKQKKATQRWLKILLHKILPEKVVAEEDYFHPLLFWDDETKTNKIEFDIWVPQFNLALEYQGEQHFHDIYGFGGGTLALNTEKDSRKKRLAQEHGIRFLAIPYWWDRKLSSLSATLYHYFPDIFPPSNGVPISALVPFRRKFSKTKVL